jgi:hypothetical protein
MQRYKEDFQFFALHSVENVEFRVSLLLRDFEKKTCTLLRPSTHHRRPRITTRTTNTAQDHHIIIYGPCKVVEINANKLQKKKREHS